jgi:exopolysaccharide production protein ExoQ
MAPINGLRLGSPGLASKLAQNWQAAGIMAFFRFLPEISVAVLFFIMGAYIPGFTTISVLLVIGLTGLIIVTRFQDSLRLISRWWPLLVYPAFTVLSALWSDFPTVTARYGLQFVFTGVIAIVVAGFVPPKRFIVIYMCTMFTFLIACIVDGTQGTAIEGAVLIGLTGSKTQIGFAAQMLLISSLTTLMLKAISPLPRIVAIMAIPLALFILATTYSASAIVMAVVGIGLLAVFWVARRFTVGGRIAAIATGIVVLLPLLALLPEAHEFYEFIVYDTLNKDPTMTGRTFLWERADALIAQRPLLGYGFQSIWLGDSTETIALQRLTHVQDLRTLHFHDQYRQILVDTGIVGLIIVLGLIVYVFATGLRQVLMRPSPELSFFFTTFVLLMARNGAEVQLVQLSNLTVLVYSCCIYICMKQQEEPALAAPARQVRSRPHIGDFRPRL